MSRRFPTPLFGVERTERRSRVFTTLAIESDGDLSKSAFVAEAITRLEKPEGGVYSEEYLRRIISTYLQLGVLRQSSDAGITVWQPARDWHQGEIDFETFLWYVLKQQWVIQGGFPEGIEGLRRILTLLSNADTSMQRGEIESSLREEFDYEFNDEGIRGFPTLLSALGAIQKTEDGYITTPKASTYLNRFRNADIHSQFERWLKQEGPQIDPPSDRVKRDLAKYYMYRESGGLGRHRQLFDTFREDYLADTALNGDPSEPKIRRAEQYVAKERERSSLRERIYEQYPTVSGDDLAGLPTTILTRMADADSLVEARRIRSTAGSGISRADVEALASTSDVAYAFDDEFSLYDWQREATEEWFDDRETPAESGIAEVVTGAGKTVMALNVIRRWLNENPSGVVTVVVPTKVLMHQWIEELIETLHVPADNIGWAGGGHKDRFDDGCRVLVSIVNSAVKDDFLQSALADADEPSHLLIADECHRYTGDTFSNIFDYHRTAELGLSATPLSSPEPDELTESDELLLSELGDVYYRLSYDEAIARELIPEFQVNYVGFELTHAERQTYETLSRNVSDAVSDIETRYGNRLYELSGNYAQKLQVIMNSADGPTPAIADYFRYTSERRELVADAVARQAITLRLLNDVIDAEQKAIVFQERIEQLERMVAPREQRGRNPRTGSIAETDVDRAKLYDRYPQLKEIDEQLESLFFSASFAPVMYHSGHHRQAWNDFAIEWFDDDGFANVMLSVKALIEGVDVPSADVGIVRVSSGSVRQRIQTLGRVLRRGGSSDRSELYVLYARDTVDETIFHEHDWEKDLANAEVRHLTWEVEDGILDGDIRPATEAEIPTGPVPERACPDSSDLERGDTYEGPREGYRFSVDADGRPFESSNDGRKYIKHAEADEIAEYVVQRNGGGSVLVNECNHAVMFVDSEPRFIGTLNPEEFEYQESDTSLVDEPAEYPFEDE
ncbi:Superfamily II DNA or RNA helicase [Halopenitus malekzadehii]|uniref:Superfamily II DNA or RNA helicase n=1 Tax=Halopenitus malekzadehii TaxID=1267564 RepID=A0A1H6K5N5_9EURY|nr:DEAD/DEAH box helicase family protein [Halopenitus malekzadehii]SEH66783.1 Superfamily II DNA or RNA helicase [Halopenitus malekzadehii]